MPPRTNNSLWDDFRTLWSLRSRVLAGDLTFILVIIGYEKGSRSINMRIYLVYALAFFTLWIFMVLTLLADLAARILTALPFGSPPVTAALTGGLALLAFLILGLYQSVRSSPLRFSDVDAQIVCAAPFDRRVVTLEWFFEAWLWRGLAVEAGAVVLGYALLQAQFPREMTPGDLPVFLIAGLRMFIIAAPLYFGVLGLAWAPGIWRLRGQREPANLRWLPVLLMVLAGAALWLGGWGAAQAWLFPLIFPVRAGLGLAPLGAGLLAAVALAVLATAALWRASRNISLARAAQESRHLVAIQAARVTGQGDLAADLAHQPRLGDSHPPAANRGWSGLYALRWKNLLQVTRRMEGSELIAWLGIFGLSLIFFTSTGWGTLVISLVVWVLMVQQRAVYPLRRDLSRWWLLRQMPFSGGSLVSVTVEYPVAGAWLAALLAAGLAVFAAQRAVPGALVWVVLVSVPGICRAGAVDVLRQSRAEQLLVANAAPSVTLLGVILGLLVVGINGGTAWLLLGGGFPSLIALLFTLTTGILVARLLGSWTGSLLRRMA